MPAAPADRQKLAMFQSLLNKCNRVAHRVLRFDLSIVYVLDSIASNMEIQNPRPSDSPYEFQLSPLSAQDVIQCANKPELDLDAEMLPRLEKGHLGYGAFCDGELVGYVWVARKNIGPEENFGCDVRTGTGFKFGQDMCFLYKCFVLQQYRGCGLFPQLMNCAFANLRQQGVSKVFSTTDWLNTSAQRGFEKIGFQRLGFIAAYLFLGKPIRHGLIPRLPEYGITIQ